MAFNALQFLVSRSVMQNEGVSPERATRLALLPAAINAPLPMSVVLSVAIGRLNTEPPTTRPAVVSSGAKGDSVAQRGRASGDKQRAEDPQKSE